MVYYGEGLLPRSTFQRRRLVCCHPEVHVGQDTSGHEFKCTLAQLRGTL